MKYHLAGKGRWGICFIAVAVMALAIGAQAFSLGKYERVRARGNLVLIPESSISGQQARFFRFDDKGKTVYFFVVRAGVGSYRTAFDACEVCYREKKGYEQVGNDMVCKSCEKHFPTNRIAPSVEPGCNPVFLQHTLSRGFIVIKTSDLRAGCRLF